MRVCAFSHSVSLFDTLRTVRRHASRRGRAAEGQRNVTVNYRYDDGACYAAKRTYYYTVYAMSYGTVSIAAVSDVGFIVYGFCVLLFY